MGQYEIEVAVLLWTYYRLGKNRPSSGIRDLYSWSALYLNANAVTVKTMASATAVLLFQFLG